MDEGKTFDLNSIAADCKINENIDAKSIIKNIDLLDKKFTKASLLHLYNHFLTLTREPEVLLYLIKKIDKYRKKSSLTPLIDLLILKGENFVEVRMQAAKVLANLKDTLAVPSLLYCLNNKDEHYRVRLACADALGKIGDKFAVNALINVVQDDEEKSVYVRESAASALGMLGDERAVEPLVQILETKKGFLDKFTFLKERAIEALSKLDFRDEKVFEAMKHSLADESPQIRINAIESLMNSDDDRAYDLIKAKLKDDDDEVKKNALIALYNMVGKDILEEVSQDKDYGDFLREEAYAMIEEWETYE